MLFLHNLLCVFQTVYSLSVSLFGFPAQLYSISHWQKQLYPSSSKSYIYTEGHPTSEIPECVKEWASDSCAFSCALFLLFVWSNTYVLGFASPHYVLLSSLRSLFSNENRKGVGSRGEAGWEGTGRSRRGENHSQGWYMRKKNLFVIKNKQTKKPKWTIKQRFFKLQVILPSNLFKLKSSSGPLAKCVLPILRITGQHRQTSVCRLHKGQADCAGDRKSKETACRPTRWFCGGKRVSWHTSLPKIDPWSPRWNKRPLPQAALWSPCPHHDMHASTHKLEIPW